jgi:hypothetical protein
VISSTKLLKAIRKHCLACSGDQKEEVLHCVMPECALYSYRMGPNYNQEVKEKEHETEE